jgi:hypothetical protein
MGRRPHLRAARSDLPAVHASFESGIGSVKDDGREHAVAQFVARNPRRAATGTPGKPALDLCNNTRFAGERGDAGIGAQAAAFAVASPRRFRSRGPCSALPRRSPRYARGPSPGGSRHYIRSIIALPKPEQLTWVAPGIRRAKS